MAPIFFARSMASFIFPGWPTSTATAITSTLCFSCSQRIATEVSRPPEYASTTLLRSDLLGFIGIWAATWNTLLRIADTKATSPVRASLLWDMPSQASIVPSKTPLPSNV